LIKSNKKAIGSGFMISMILVVVALILFSTYLYSSYNQIKDAANDASSLEDQANALGVDISNSGAIKFDALEKLDKKYLEYVNTFIHQVFDYDENTKYASTKNFRTFDYYPAEKFTDYGIQIVDSGNNLKIFIKYKNDLYFYGDKTNYKFLENKHVAVVAYGDWSEDDITSNTKESRKKNVFAPLFLLNNYCPRIINYKTQYTDSIFKSTEWWDCSLSSCEDFLNEIEEEYITNIQNYVFPAETLLITTRNENTVSESENMDGTDYWYKNSPELSFRRFQENNLNTAVKNYNRFFSKLKSQHPLLKLSSDDSKKLGNHVNSIMKSENYIDTSKDISFVVFFNAGDGDPTTHIKSSGSDYEITSYSILNYEAADLIVSKINECN
jgi:hypothetical protein